MSVKNKNASYFIAVFRGFYWNIKYFRNTIKFRKKIQKSRIIDDKYIEKHMIKQSIELQGIKLIINQFLKKRKK